MFGRGRFLLSVMPCIEFEKLGHDRSRSHQLHSEPHTVREGGRGERERGRDMVREGPREAGEQRKARSSHYAMATYTPCCPHGLVGGYIREPSILFPNGSRLRQSHARRQGSAESIPRLQPTISQKPTFSGRRRQRLVVVGGCLGGPCARLRLVLGVGRGWGMGKRGREREREAQPGP